MRTGERSDGCKSLSLKKEEETRSQLRFLDFLEAVWKRQGNRLFF